MSLYGNVKKIASSTFQFDRVYPTRKDMDDNCKSDGVYAGRYVLINYGPDGIRYNSETGEELPEYIENQDTDLEQYSSTYDSTVWQKIYGPESGEKYIMVAELNALAPKVELIVEDPIKYISSDETHPPVDPENGIYGDEINVVDYGTDRALNVFPILNGGYEIPVEPKFDAIKSNPLNYYLHMPKPINLEVKDENINYNKDGFDQVYHIEEASTGYKKNVNSFITWTPKHIEYQDITSPKTEDTKVLHMNLPQFGNTMQELFDLIYGKPDESDPSKVRPYFKDYWPDTITVNNQEVDRTYQNDDREWLMDVPGLGDILKNNRAGLMGVLSNLFASRDPLTGTVTYYVKSDWVNNNYLDYTDSQISNDPFIDNKPAVVGSKQTKIYGSVGTEEEDSFITVTEAQNTNCDLIIDYKSWTIDWVQASGQ